MATKNETSSRGHHRGFVIPAVYRVFRGDRVYVEVHLAFDHRTSRGHDRPLSLSGGFRPRVQTLGHLNGVKLRLIEPPWGRSNIRLYLK